MSWPAFDVQSWLQANPPAACDDAQLSQPVRHGKGWTKRNNRIEHGDCSGLQSLKLPPCPIDLNRGIENFVPNSPDSPIGVEIVIEAILKSGAEIHDGGVITFRNNLNKIFGTVFEKKSCWTVDGTSYRLSTQQKEIILLDIVNKPATEAKCDINTIYGYQFEANCCGQAIADASEEYGMLSSTKIFRRRAKASGLHLYIGAEIDAYEDAGPKSQTRDEQREPPPVECLRELKTFRKPAHPGQQRTLYGLKYPKWWLQSYLVGVPSLILGARNKDGIVEEILSIRTLELPRRSWNHGMLWSPTQALAFGLDVLTWMKGIVTDHSLGGVRHFRFEYKPELCMICVSEIQGEGLIARVQGALWSPRVAPMG